eukprot:scaffold259199_cov14-Prasinocladus_malaysianus.AAC.1
MASLDIDQAKDPIQMRQSFKLLINGRGPQLVCKRIAPSSKTWIIIMIYLARCCRRFRGVRHSRDKGVRAKRSMHFSNGHWSGGSQASML